ncbi:MAG: hypothetical protein N3D77_04720 [Geminicoccaceae bacterium]|nr:hypothetical protein [Geminicoccaceae bacterium]
MTPARTVGALGLTARRRRQRAVAIGLALLGGLVLFLFSLGAAYLVGVAQSASERERLVADLEAARAASREAVARAAAVEERFARLATQRQAAAPAEPVRRPELEPLLPLLEARLREGVPVDRLARAILALPREPVCDPESEVKSLPVAITPMRESGSRSFGGGRFTVAARGVAAKSPTGRTEAWFDPAQPVQLVIRLAGQEPRLASRVLPFEETLVLERREYRFAARAGERRGMLEVTLRVCDYP